MHHGEELVQVGHVSAVDDCAAGGFRRSDWMLCMYGIAFQAERHGVLVWKCGKRGHGVRNMAVKFRMGDPNSSRSEWGGCSLPEGGTGNPHRDAVRGRRNVVGTRGLGGRGGKSGCLKSFRQVSVSMSHQCEPKGLLFRAHTDQRVGEAPYLANGWDLIPSSMGDGLSVEPSPCAVVSCGSRTRLIVNKVAEKERWMMERLRWKA